MLHTKSIATAKTTTSKLLLLLITLSCAGIFQSCDKVKEAIKVNVPVKVDEQTFTIPVIPEAGEADLGTITVAINIDSLIRTQDAGVGVEHIRSATIRSCRLEISEESRHEEDNFTALQYCHADFYSDAKPEWVRIAGVDTPPADPYVLDLPVNSSLDFTPYFKGTNFSFRISGAVSRPTENPIEVRVVVVFDIVAGL